MTGTKKKSFFEAKCDVFWGKVEDFIEKCNKGKVELDKSMISEGDLLLCDQWEKTYTQLRPSTRETWIITCPERRVIRKRRLNVEEMETISFFFDNYKNIAV